jgi:hypothetical protein
LDGEREQPGQRRPCAIAMTTAASENVIDAKLPATSWSSSSHSHTRVDATKSGSR